MVTKVGSTRFSWFDRYKKEYFSFDLIAGLTVGIMAIPQVSSFSLPNA